MASVRENFENKVIQQFENGTQYPTLDSLASLPISLKENIMAKRQTSNQGLYHDSGFLSNIVDAYNMNGGGRVLAEHYIYHVHNTCAGEINKVIQPGYVKSHAYIPTLPMAGYRP